MNLLFRPYLRYKFLNALFTGIVGGSIFTIYASLSPSIFSIGGILLALGMMGMAYLYHRLMRMEYFFRFSLVSELIMLGMVAYFLLFSSQPLTALVIYGAYQLSFILGGYLARAETHFAQKARIMGWIDIAKQQGHMSGLALSYGFYTLLGHFKITDAAAQVYLLHWLLFPLEGLIVVLLIRSFSRSGGGAMRDEIDTERIANRVL